MFLKNSHVVFTAVKFNLVAVSFLIYSTLKQSTLHLNLSFTMLGVIQEAVIKHGEPYILDKSLC